MKKLLKNKIVLVAITLLLNNLANAQGGKWTWMHGTNLGNDAGNYGIIGVPAATNTPPSRYQAAYWTDLNGDFWMFGGAIASGGGFNSTGNDMWRYSVASGFWTWMSGPQYSANTAGNYGTLGVPSVNNCPCARGYGAACWTDKNNNLWLFGGSGAGDDLWKYTIATNEWTWVKGSLSNTTSTYGTMGIANINNTPGGRQEVKSGWVTANNDLWMFGGWSASSFDLQSDLWRYNISTNEWTWMKGSSIGANTGTYGTLGVEAASNEPPCRWSYTKWRDINDNFYIFAGGDASTDYNDVWKYNPITNNWSWISGTNLINDLGGNPAQCTQNTSLFPESRVENQTVSTVGCTQAFWSFGGLNSQSQMLNDLWLYDAGKNKWTFVSGNLNVTSIGNFGSKGVYAASNMIPGKMGLCIWTDQQNNLWVFGGHSDSWVTTTNDLWKFEPDTACFKTSLSQNFSIPMPTDTLFCGDQTVEMDLPKMKIIQILPATGFTFNADSTKIIYSLNATTTYTIIGEDNGTCPGKDTIAFTIRKVPDPIAEFAVTPDETTLEFPTFQLINTSFNAVKYEWYYSNSLFSTQTNESKTFGTEGTYCFTLVAFNSEGCTDTVTHCGNIIPDAWLTMPNSFSPNGDGKNDIIKPVSKNITNGTFKIFNRYGEMVYSNTDLTKGWDGIFNGNRCELGVYYYYLTYKKNNGKEKMLKGDIELIK
jgi:gliding motility-associated-like protein